MKAREIWPELLQVRTYQWLSLSIEIVSHQPLVVGQRPVSVLADYTSLLLNPSSCPWAHIQEFIPYLLHEDEFTTLERKWTPALQKFLIILSCKPASQAAPWHFSLLLWPPKKIHSFSSVLFSSEQRYAPATLHWGCRAGLSALCSSSCDAASCCRRRRGLQTVALSPSIWPHMCTRRGGTSKPLVVIQPTAAKINYHSGLWPCLACSGPETSCHLHVAPSEPQILILLHVNGLVVPWGVNGQGGLLCAGCHAMHHCK